MKLKLKGPYFLKGCLQSREISEKAVKFSLNQTYIYGICFSSSLLSIKFIIKFIEESLSMYIYCSMRFISNKIFFTFKFWVCPLKYVLKKLVQLLLHRMVLRIEWLTLGLSLENWERKEQPVRTFTRIRKITVILLSIEKIIFKLPISDKIANSFVDFDR